VSANPLLLRTGRQCRAVSTDSVGPPPQSKTLGAKGRAVNPPSVDYIYWTFSSAAQSISAFVALFSICCTLPVRYWQPWVRKWNANLVLRLGLARQSRGADT
jgi:hypothetical protein